MVTRSIVGQLGGEPDHLAHVASEIAIGNLVIDVQVRDGDTSSLMAAMKAMRDSLTQVVSNVRQSSDSIATGRAQIGTGNADLSQCTEEQASNLQQTAASMEQQTATVKQNSDTARQANADQIKPAPECNHAVPDHHITGIATVMQGEVQRMLVLVDIEQLMSSAEMGLVDVAAPCALKLSYPSHRANPALHLHISEGTS